MEDQPIRSRERGNLRKVSPEIEALHRRCGVYTKLDVVRRILDAVRWKGDADLSSSRLLEPACGDGAFVVEAARRLVSSLARRRLPLTARTLRARIKAFELHPREARRARQRLIETLRAAGVHHRTAEACARSWVIEGDFLLPSHRSATFTHAVGNPPYVRWSLIPPALRRRYERQLSPTMAAGDLMLPVLDCALESIVPAGRFGFVCSDRWRYMAFAEAFREKWIPKLTIHSERSLPAADAFMEPVGSYPTVVIGSITSSTTKKPSPLKSSPRGKTLSDLGCTVRVGPALGHTPAYVLDLEEDDVERELLQPWIDGSEIGDGRIAWTGRRVIVMYGSDGKLLDLKHYPRLKKRLQRFRVQLKQRSIVSNGAPWYRPIDRVDALNWSRPKLLVPELAKTPRVAIDYSGAVPSHGVYAIFAEDDDVARIYDKLKDGKLAAALDGMAPRVNSGFVRCYKRFLLMARFGSG